MLLIGFMVTWVVGCDCDLLVVVFAFVCIAGYSFTACLCLFASLFAGDYVGLCVGILFRWFG